MLVFILNWLAFNISQRLRQGPVLPEQVTHTYINTLKSIFTQSGFDPFVWDTCSRLVLVMVLHNIMQQLYIHRSRRYLQLARVAQKVLMHPTGIKQSPN